MARKPNFYDKIDKIADMLYSGLNDLFKKHNIPSHVRGMGTCFGIYFGVENPEDDYDCRKVASKFNYSMSSKFILEALDEGLYFNDYCNSPVPMHNGFSTQHSMKDIEITLNKIDRVFGKIRCNSNHIINMFL